MGETIKGRLDLLRKYRDSEGQEREMLEEQIVVENWNLVYTVSVQFHHRNLDQEDLHAIGLIGLLKAIRSFNPDKGLAFSTYAVPSIRNAIFMELRKFMARKREGESGLLSLEYETQRDSDNKATTLLDSLASTDDSPLGLVEAEELQKALDHVIYGTTILTDSQRDALLLTMEGMTQAEIAGVTGFSQSYVSRCIVNARYKISQYLKRTENI